MRKTSVLGRESLSQTVLMHSSLNRDKLSSNSWKLPTFCGELLSEFVVDSTLMMNLVKRWTFENVRDPIKNTAKRKYRF